MKEVWVSITQRGQVTLPAEVRRRLGLGPRDKVIFEIGEDAIRVKRPAMTLKETFSSIKALHRPEDFEKVIREAKDEKAARAGRELRQS